MNTHLMSSKEPDSSIKTYGSERREIKKRKTATLKQQFNFMFTLSVCFSLLSVTSFIAGLKWVSTVNTHQAANSLRLLLISQITLIVVLAGIGTVVGLTMRSRIRSSVNTLRIVLDDAAEGDFTNRARVYFTDEIGQLSEDTNCALEFLAELVGKLRDGAEQLSDFAGFATQEAESIKSGAETVENSSLKLSAAGQELYKSAESLRENGSTVSGDIARLSSISRENDQLAAQGITAALSLQKAMDELTRSVDNIADLMNTIEQISGETNMLALNATIEAASTGEAGKGFQVVANQAKELAVQTAGTTMEVLSEVAVLQKHAANTKTKIENMVSELKSLSKKQQDVSEVVSVQQDALTTTNKQIAKVEVLMKEVLSLAGGLAQEVSQSHQQSEEFQNHVSVMHQGVDALEDRVARFQV